MDGNNLRERRPQRDHNNQSDHNDDMQSCSKERKSEKTCGRTPEGIGESSASLIFRGRIKLVGSEANKLIRTVVSLNIITTADIDLQ